IAGCLNSQETYILADAYRFLRKVEHRLQLLFDLQTHKLPTGEEELRKLARRMGYSEPENREQRTEDRSQKTEDREQKTEDRKAGGVLSSLTSDLWPLTSGEGERPPLAAQKRSPLDEADPPPLDTRDLLVDPLDQFLKDLHDKSALDRTILNHLLHQTFADADGRAEPESDLILDPDPDEATVRAVLGRYRFRDVTKAYQNLSQLG